MPHVDEPTPELGGATSSRRAFLIAGVVGVAGVYSALRLLPAAIAAPSTGSLRGRTAGVMGPNLIANSSFQAGAVGWSAPSWTIS